MIFSLREEQNLQGLFMKRISFYFSLIFSTRVFVSKAFFAGFFLVFSFAEWYTMCRNDYAFCSLI